jgi:hypothetical protein
MASKQKLLKSQGKARQEAESSKVEVKVEVQFASRLALKSREEIWSQAAASLKPSVRAGSDNLRHRVVSDGGSARGGRGVV